MLESARRWREANREKVRATNKRWRQRHREQVRARKRRWVLEHPQAKRAWDKVYRERHHEAVLETIKEWQRTHRDRVRASQARARERRDPILPLMREVRRTRRFIRDIQRALSELRGGRES